MNGRRSQQPNLEAVNREIDRTFHRNLRSLDSQEEIEIENMAEQERVFKDYFSPLANPTTSCIVLPDTNAANFELKPSVLNCLPNFYGLDKEDPYNHLNDFYAICATFKYPNFSAENVRLRLFPFSLKDRAKSWLNSLEPGSIRTWDQMVEKFLSKYFPVHKTNAIRKEIANFTQKEGEHLYESWERFNSILLRCPHHGFEKWRLCQFFQDGLTPQNRCLIDATSGGKLMSKSAAEIWEFFQTMSDNSQQWDWSNQNERRKGGLYEVQSATPNPELKEVKAVIEGLSRQIATLVAGNHHETFDRNQHDQHGFLNPTHQSHPHAADYDIFSDQVNSLNLTRKPPTYNPYSNTYNPGWRDHPNFSWSQGNQQGGLASQVPQPAFKQFNSNFQQPKPWEEAIQKLTKSTQVVLDQHSQAITELQHEMRTNHTSQSQSISNIEKMMGQLASTIQNLATNIEIGKFPS